jgi:hypothetical protein
VIAFIYGQHNVQTHLPSTATSSRSAENFRASPRKN